jgi:hypothetical protein
MTGFLLGRVAVFARAMISATAERSHEDSREQLRQGSPGERSPSAAASMILTAFVTLL